MATYNSLIDRDDSAPLIPEEVEPAIFAAMEEQSHIFRLARRLRDGSRGELRLKVAESLPVAYFVEGDSGLIQTSEHTWSNETLTYHKIGVILPIPEDVDADSEVSLFDAMIPAIGGAFAAKIDGAVLEGTDVPASYEWPSNLSTGCTSASHSVDLSSIVGASGDLYDALLGDSPSAGVLSLLEADGFESTGALAALAMKAKLRGMRGTDDHPLFTAMPQDASRYQLDGAPIFFPKNGCITPASNLLFAGDWQQLVHSVRRGMTYKVLDQAVITDGAGNVIYNFAQQEMKGLRVTMRWGWALPNPVNRVNSSASTRYPFAKLVP